MSQDMLPAPEDAPRRKASALKATARWSLVGFAVLTVGLTVAMYQFGDGVVWVGDRTVSDMNPFEVTGAGAAGAAGLVVGVGALIVALVAALIATIASVAVALLGTGVGLFFAMGFALGPIFLAVILGVLIKRRYWPDVV